MIALRRILYLNRANCFYQFAFLSLQYPISYYTFSLEANKHKMFFLRRLHLHYILLFYVPTLPLSFFTFLALASFYTLPLTSFTFLPIAFFIPLLSTSFPPLSKLILVEPV